MKKMTKFQASFSHAFRGMVLAFCSERSFRVQVGVGFLVIVCLLIFPLRNLERILLILLIGSVLILELINSVFERLVDAFKPRVHPLVKDMKDLMAAAVLLASLVSAVVGLMIFVPHLF